MSAIPGMLGLGGGEQGTGVASPQLANVVNPVTPEQIAQAYSGVQGGIGGQQALLNALNQQNGIGNQNQVFSQLQGIASGMGPNPAQAQYQQNVNQIAAQQAGALASAKGISPALQARLTAQQGGAAMQNAAGQGAANLATQQLNAMAGAGDMANQMANNQLGQSNAVTNSNLNLYNAMLGNQQAVNQSMVSNQGNVNNANTSIIGGIQQNQGKAIGGLFKGASSAAGGASAWDGGLIEADGPSSGLGRHMKNYKQGGYVPGKAQVQGDSPKNDTVHAKLSPGEIVIPRSVVNSKKPSEAAARFVEAVLAKKGKK